MLKYVDSCWLSSDKENGTCLKNRSFDDEQVVLEQGGKFQSFVGFIWSMSFLGLDGLNISSYDACNGCNPFILDVVLKNCKKIKLCAYYQL